MTESEQEKKNKRTALITTIGVNAIVLLLLFIVAAWRAPNPPNPEYGIELNFGTDDAGSGNVQPTEPVGTPETTAEETIEPESATEETQESAPVESAPEAQPEVTSKVESPVTVKEEKKVEPQPKETEKKSEVTKPVEKKVEEKPVEKKPDPKPDPALDRLLNTKKGTQGSEGDDAGKTGDKGNPQGKDPNAPYQGTPGGGGGGFGLNMAGWAWDDEPKAPGIPDTRAGKIVFEIEVDDNGDIMGIRTIESTLSAEAERLFKQEIQKRSLTKTSAGSAPPLSKGIVTFNLYVK